MQSIMDGNFVQWKITKLAGNHKKIYKFTNLYDNYFVYNYNFIAIHKVVHVSLFLKSTLGRNNQQNIVFLIGLHTNH